jgi:two-component system response regulator TctD
MLPDGDGRDFLKKRRREENRTPVLVLTARSQITDRVRMLDLGADDYVTKPFDFDELMARCRAVLRRHRGSARNLTTFEGLAFDAEAGSLAVAGEAVDLRNRELRLFEVFIAAPNRVLPKQYLMERLFSLNEEASENAIEVYIARLRKKIEGSGARIDTVRGLGYRLTKAG